MADGELQIFVDKSIKQRLREKVKNPEDTEVNSVFYLYGEILQSKVYVVGCIACRRFIAVPKNGYPAIPDWKNEQDELCCLIPNGLQLCGIYYCCVKETNLEASELQRLYDGLPLKGDSGKQVVVQYCSSSDGQKCFIYDKNLGSISGCECQEADILGEFWEQRICFRLQACIPVLVGKDERGSSPDVMNKIKKACQELSSASSVFYIKDCNILLKNRDSERGEKETCDDLVMKMESRQEKSSDQQGHSKGRGKQKSGKMLSFTNTRKIENVLDVRFLNQLTDTDENSKAYHVPVIHFQKCISSQVKLNLSLDILFYVSKESLLTSLPNLFTSGMNNQLRKMGSVIKEFCKDGESLSVPNVYHFKPPGFCHLVTAVYPSVNDDQLVPFRLELHKRLLLPQNRPLLRSSNKYLFNNEQQQGIYLTNPHSGLTGGVCGTVAVVDGTYTYHHYMQDNFNDDGWGCAYRSLQTIVSWFRHQGYTSKPVPSHREIQQALVDLQDKTEKFVGSRQWIGSFEVSMCLEHLLGVTSKIMFVNSGAEMRSKGRDLLYHFQTQGTPVMIGGGVLAHTILGVDFNDQTGDIRFLILDPHYTGGEDLKVILDKGWCGWKGADFWNQQVYYNMCMPQRPDMI